MQTLLVNRIMLSRDYISFALEHIKSQQLVLGTDRAVNLAIRMLIGILSSFSFFILFLTTIIFKPKVILIIKSYLLILFEKTSTNISFLNFTKKRIVLFFCNTPNTETYTTFYYSFMKFSLSIFRIFKLKSFENYQYLWFFDCLKKFAFSKNTFIMSFILDSISFK